MKKNIALKDKKTRKEISELQLERLRNMVDYCINNVPFYRNKFIEVGITSGKQIKKLFDISKLPFTTKKELQDNYPNGILAVPMNKIVRIHASSGTKGNPTVGYYTKKDIKIWSEATKRVLQISGVNKNSVVQISLGYGLFTGGLGFHQGAEKLGCTIIPSSAGNSKKQLVMMKDIKTDVLMTTPSYATYLSELINDSETFRDNIKLKKVLLGAERCTKAMRQTIENNLNCEVLENYGLTECFGPGIAGECEEHNGMHILEDIFYPEIIDSETGEVLEDGKQGELVFTSLCREAMPLLRYRTGDITTLTHKKCKCGRTLVRMSAPYARVDDMFVLKGVNVFPTQIEYALEGIKNINPYYLIKLERKNLKDNATIIIELEKNKDLYTEYELQKIHKNIKRKLEEVVIVKMDIKLVNPNTLERVTGKSKRVEDLRYDLEK